MKLMLKQLNKAFGMPVLRDISYTFEPGRLYVIKGVSGCGKTTLLNILGGIETEYEGSVIREGEARTATVFQKSLLLKGLTARENLLLIRNDPQRVEELASGLGIRELLDKYPEQLSGGERQRVSVARALLNDPQLILADEPTASLDGESSEKTASLLAGLRREDRIIIVATHESCFDALADVILRLDYGVLREEAVRSTSLPPLAAPVSPLPNAEKRRTLRYSLKRHPELLRPKSLLPLALAFLMLLLAGTLQQCFDEEALRFYTRKYPMNIVGFTEEQYQAFEHKEWVTLYECVEAKENGLTAYYLMPEEDSVLHVEGMLAFGRFPRKIDEVILTREAADLLFPGTDFADCIGRRFVFCGRTWTVSAVTAERTADFNTNFRADHYYAFAEEAAVFIFYNELREFGEAKEPAGLSGSRMSVVEGLALDPEKQAAVKEALTIRIEVHGIVIEEVEGSFNIYYSLIDVAQERINEVMKYFLLIFLLISLLICLYMISVIRTELFYRRLELGCLQIFGLGRRDTGRMLSGEYAVKAACAAGLSFAVLAVLILLYRLLFGSWVRPSLTSVLICLLLGLMYLGFAVGTIRTFLKKSIVSLIH